MTSPQSMAISLALGGFVVFGVWLITVGGWVWAGLVFGVSFWGYREWIVDGVK